jgi:LmbE family N-acetylglucosaminyl deacetylase
MIWIYLSPHFDDVALSCGGLVWEQTHTGDDVRIWTICGGEPAQEIHSPIVDELHARWKSGDQAANLRKNEDILSCRLLNASYRHFDIPDCIYRVDENNNPLYPTEESLFGPVNPFEAHIMDFLAQELDRSIPAQAQVVSPMAIGNHVDHQLVRQMIAKTGKAPWFYEDFPYVIKKPGDLSHFIDESWVAETFPISEEGMQAWLKSVSAHQSQLSTFWKTPREMESDFRNYVKNNQGMVLWRLD